MTTALLLLAWLLVGVLVAAQGPRPAWERALALLFWPFFVFEGVALAPPAAAAPPPTPGPLSRLEAALGAEDPARGLVAELGRALRAQEERVGRLDAALAALGPAVGGDPARDLAVDPALARARDRSRALLHQARAAEQRALGEALAAIEEAATRLLLLRAGAERGEVEALLQGLAARLRAGEEVDGRADAHGLG